MLWVAGRIRTEERHNDEWRRRDADQEEDDDPHTHEARMHWCAYENGERGC